MPLVDQPLFRITPYLLKLIEQAGELRLWIETATLKVPWLPLLQSEARIRRTRASTSIEGNPLGLEQAAAVERGESTGWPENYEKEIKNYLAVMRWIEKHAHSALSEKNLLRLHALLTRGLLSAERCGRYKIKQNYVVNENGLKIYTPPNPTETPKLVKALIEWLNARETKELHSVIVGAIFHHRLVSIHPFSDGNGRLARAVGTWLLFQQDFDLNHIFSLDDYFAGDRARYYQKIEQARELDNDLTHWIEYVAEGIIDTLKKVRRRIEGLQIKGKIEMRLTPRQEELLRILRETPTMNVAEFQKKLKLTRARINQIIKPLIASGLVIMEGQSKATRYHLCLPK